MPALPALNILIPSYMLMNQTTLYTCLPLFAFFSCVISTSSQKKTFAHYYLNLNTAFILVPDLQLSMFITKISPNLYLFIVKLSICRKSSYV